MSSHMTPGQTCTARACNTRFCHKREPNTYCGIGSSLNKNTETVGSCCTTVVWEDPPPLQSAITLSRRELEGILQQQISSLSKRAKQETTREQTNSCSAPQVMKRAHQGVDHLMALHLTMNYKECPGATDHLLHSQLSKCLPLRGHLHILGLTASSLAVVPLGYCSNSCHQAFKISHSESFTPRWRRSGQLFFTVWIQPHWRVVQHEQPV